MHGLATLLLALSTLALRVDGLSTPGKRLALAKRRPFIPRTLRGPSFNKREANPGVVDINISPLEKKDILGARQTCPIGSSLCSSGGCCDGECCGEGCCPAGFRCRFVGTEPGCCPIGETCSDQISGCADTGYVECDGYDFCCPRGQGCGLDSSGEPECNTSGGGSDPISTRTTSTRTSTTTTDRFSVPSVNSVDFGALSSIGLPSSFRPTNTPTGNSPLTNGASTNVAMGSARMTFGAMFAACLTGVVAL